MAQQLVYRFRSLVSWATTTHRRPARRHSRGGRRRAAVPMHADRTSRPMTVMPAHGARPPVPAVGLMERVASPAPLTPTLRHLGVVGMPGTIGAAARTASARAAAERRFNGSDPRARLIDPRHPAMWRP